MTQDQTAYNTGHAMRRDGRDVRRPLNEEARWSINKLFAYDELVYGENEDNEEDAKG